MPCLKEDLATFLMNGICYQPPSLSMVLVNHDWAVVPVTARPVDEGALIYNQSNPVTGPVGIVPDLSWAWLQVINASVPGHRAHDNSVSQRQLSADNDWLKKAGHDDW